MDTFDLSQAIRVQSLKRKTIDLTLLQQYVIDRTNAINLSASNNNMNQNGYGWEDGNFHVRGTRSAIAIVNVVLEDFMHMLNCYSGYNSRMWLAFTDLAGWLDVIHELQAIDDKQGTRHYWKLLDRLDYGHRKECKGFFGFGGNCPEPTKGELSRAQRILDHYMFVLGL